MAEVVQSSEIYRLHVMLLHINPPIWRRLLVRSNTSIADLHDILQISFEWTDFHLKIGSGFYNLTNGGN